VSRIGSSFVQVGDADIDPEIEMYVDVHEGDDRWSSPDPRLDAIIDLFGHALTTYSACLWRSGGSGGAAEGRGLVGDA
jgi:hypothetical protein